MKVEISNELFDALSKLQYAMRFYFDEISEEISDENEDEDDVYYRFLATSEIKLPSIYLKRGEFNALRNEELE